MIEPRHAGQQAGDNLVVGAPTGRRHVFGGDGRRPLLPDEDCRIAFLYAATIAAVRNELIHAHAPYNRTHPAAEQHGAAVGEGDAQAIAIAGGEGCKARGLGRVVGAAITHRRAGRHVAQPDDARLEGEHGAECRREG